MPSDIRPGRTEVLLKQAQAIAERSTCTRASVGVVIAHDGRTVSQGYNGAPAGMAHCNHACMCGGRGLAPVCSDTCRYPKAGGWHNYDCAFRIWTDDDHHLTDCPTNNKDGCRVSVHAEANAIAFAARFGVATDGAYLYTTVSPCLTCSQLIINAGIKRVYFIQEYRDHAGIDLLRDAGIGVLMMTGPSERRF